MAADKLSIIIDWCLVDNNLTTWFDLFLYSYASLSVPDRGNNISLTSSVKMNILSGHPKFQQQLNRQFYGDKSFEQFIQTY